MPGADFRTTSWSLILAAASEPTTATRQALATLCQTYWNPVYAFIRRNGYDPDRAQDLTQEFFSILIEKNYLEDADRRRGRFRSFLLTSVKHFLANEWDKARAQKRGGGHAPISIDATEAERWYVPAVADEITPETLFERRWAVSLLERVMAMLRAEYTASGKEELFMSLEVFLNHDSDEGYDELAARMNTSAGALRMAVLRMRKKYRALLRAEIAETVEWPEEVDEEIRFLVSTLGGR
jgi:RNA polymerase sigma-70 factor (ECF subfamily)